MQFQCWASVEDGGPTLKPHLVNAPCSLGYTFLFSLTAEKKRGHYRLHFSNDYHGDSCTCNCRACTATHILRRHETLIQCWAEGVDDGSTINLYWVIVLTLLMCLPCLRSQKIRTWPFHKLFGRWWNTEFIQNLWKCQAPTYRKYMHVKATQSPLFLGLIHDTKKLSYIPWLMIFIIKDVLNVDL